MKTLIFKVLLIFVLFYNVKSEDLPIGSKCESHDGSEGSCVIVNNCVSIVEKLRNRSIAMNQIKICNQKNRYVCCPAESTTKKDLIIEGSKNIQPDLKKCKIIFILRLLL